MAVDDGRNSQSNSKGNTSTITIDNLVEDLSINGRAEDSPGSEDSYEMLASADSPHSSSSPSDDSQETQTKELTSTLTSSYTILYDTCVRNTLISDARKLIESFPRIKEPDWSTEPLCIAYFASKLPSEYPWLHTGPPSDSVQDIFSMCLGDALLNQMDEFRQMKIRRKFKVTVYNVLKAIDQGNVHTVVLGPYNPYMDFPAPLGVDEPICLYVNRIREYIVYGLSGSLNDTSVHSLKYLRMVLERSLPPNYQHAAMSFPSRMHGYLECKTVDDCLNYIEKHFNNLVPDEHLAAKQNEIGKNNRRRKRSGATTRNRG